ncbi:hypothetical protein P389DRAFT_79949 [Cystobasidium minutum MCA 4210]|uniref:uncharacterized protein n=1 Tax=Cystobasidium minutum MCA 4210 TaxID=1397322 RepID=UPI0034CDA98D|eukprot:jgi/Rhomi1/79949/CE79948_24
MWFLHPRTTALLIVLASQSSDSDGSRRCTGTGFLDHVFFFQGCFDQACRIRIFCRYRMVVVSLPRTFLASAARWFSLTLSLR